MTILFDNPGPYFEVMEGLRRTRRCENPNREEPHEAPHAEPTRRLGFGPFLLGLATGLIACTVLQAW